MMLSRITPARTLGQLQPGGKFTARNYSQEKHSKQKWYWQGGAGWPSQGMSSESLPYLFKSLGDLLVYWEMGAAFWGFEVYTLNGVSPSLALCVMNSADKWGYGALYIAPSHATEFWYYLYSLGCPPSLNAGPVVSSSAAHSLGASYVSISQGDPTHAGQLFWVNTTNGVTELNSGAT